MSKPLEICIEELGLDAEEEGFVRCVALPGDEPGLALDSQGVVQWMPDGPGSCGLWVSADDRLVLFRAQGAGPVTVSRGQRSVEAPVDKPVILMDQDLLLISDRRLRVHVHGQTEAVYAPERLKASAFGRLARAAAAAATLALGSASAAASGGAGAMAQPAAGEPAPIEVRARPPKVSPRERVECDITGQQPRRGGPLVLYATCPKGKKLGVGNTGEILDPKTGNGMAGGLVTVTRVNGSRIVVEAKTLKKAVTATKIRFWISRY